MFEHFSNKKRIAELEESFAKIKSDLAGLRLEWNDTLDRLVRITGRIAKRDALAQEKEDLLMGAAPDAGVEASGLVLTPRQRLIQQQIAARRASSTRDGK